MICELDVADDGGEMRVCVFEQGRGMISSSATEFH